jgi:hypothetical protein
MSAHKTKYLVTLIVIGLAIALLLASPVAASETGWDKSSITLTGQCLADGSAEFSVTNTGADMTGPSPWREYEDGSLAQSGEFTLAAGATQTWTFASNGVPIRFEADQRPGHPGSSAPHLTLTCERPTAVTLTTFAATSTRLLSAICQKGVVTDVLSAPGGHVVYVVREGHTLSDSYWTIRNFKVTQRVNVCAGIVK